MTINVAHGESQIFGLSGAGEESLRSVGWEMMDRGRSLGWEGGWMMWRRLAGEEKTEREEYLRRVMEKVLEPGSDLQLSEGPNLVLKADSGMHSK
jgi:hypothetical protein